MATEQASESTMASLGSITIVVDLPAKALPLFTLQKVADPEDGSEFRSLLFLNQLAIQGLRTAFPQDHELVVLAVAGPSGAGKSTWLNAIAMHLDKNIVEPPFQCSDSQTGATKGMMVYPKPLPVDTHTSLLLCDMEGMDGLREDMNRAETSKLIQRMFFVSLAISSRICIHSPQRIPGSLMEAIKDMLEVVNDLKTTVDVDVPNVTLLVGDTSEIKDPQTVKNAIKTHCEVSDELVDLISICPRGRPSGSFFEHPSVPELLHGPYHTSLTQFLADCVKYPKSRPGLNRPITINELVSTLLLLTDVVNSRNYMDKYLASVEKRIKKVLQPEVARLGKEFRKKVIESAKECEAETEAEDFDKEAKKERDAVIKDFQEFVEKNVKGKHRSCDTVRRALEEFADSLTYEAEVELFRQRHKNYLADVAHQAELAKLQSPPSPISVLSVPSDLSSLSLVKDSSFSCEQPSFSQHYSVNPSRFDQITSMLDSSIDRSTISYSIPEVKSSSMVRGPLKKDGTPDMRYSVNREAAGNRIQMSIGSGGYGSSRMYDIPLKKDGTPDMRYSINKQLFGGGSSRRRRW